jgi:L-amino acid N-acyltransferase
MRFSMNIRPARASDAEAIRAMYNDAVATTTATMDTQPRTPEQQAEWLREHDGDPYPAIVAEDARGRVLGYAALSPFNAKPGYASTAEVSVYVHRDWRGHGVGKELMAALVEDAERRGFHALVALISSGNAASQRLHEHSGFVVAGTLPRVARKFDTWIDVLIVQRNLHGAEAEPASEDDEDAPVAAATS